MTTLAAPTLPRSQQPVYQELPHVHAEYMLRNAAVRSWPYAHTVVRPIMPSWYYDQMIASFPEDGAFTPLNQYHPDRGALFLTDKGDGTDDLSRLEGAQRSFWEQFVAMFGSERFRRVLLERLGGPSFADRYAARSRPLMHLSLDKCGYQILPHTDVASKIVTALFYLPDPGDMSHEGFGTSVLVEKPNPGAAGPHDWERYEVAYTAPFVANTMFTFAVGSSSWHAVKPVDQAVRRRSLQYFVFLDK